MNKKSELRIKILRARTVMLFLALVSIINAVMIFTEKSEILPFSFATVTYTLVTGYIAAAEGGQAIYILSLVISGGVFLTGVFSYFLSKKNAKWLFVALVLSIFDTVGLIFFMFMYGFGYVFIFDLIIHGMVVFYLLLGVKASKEMAAMPESFEAGSEAPEANTPAQPAQKEELSEPIRDYNGEGERLLYGSFNGLNIKVVACEEEGSVLLVINGAVCDEAEYSETVSLNAIVNGTDILFEQEDGMAYLYADDDLLDKAALER